MTEHRWTKFWWQDYEADDALRVVSLAAQGLWMRLLCAMHKGTPYGHLTINGHAPTMRQLAILAGTTEGKIKKLMQELKKETVFSVTETGVIFCRRMVRDKEISERGQQDGKRGGNPTLKAKPQQGLTPPVNGGGYTLEAEADTEAESKKEAPSLREPPQAVASPSAPPPRQATGTRLPDEWQPAQPGFEGATGNTLAKFRDYWRAQPGAKGRKTDWQATWRNWCRRDAEQPKPKLHTLPQHEQDRRILAAVGLRFDDPEPVVHIPTRIAQ